MGNLNSMTDEELLQIYNESSSERDFARRCGYASRIRRRDGTPEHNRLTRLGIVFPKLSTNEKHPRHMSRTCKICGKPLWDTNVSGMCKLCKKRSDDKNKIDCWLKTGNTQCGVQTTLRNCIRKYILDQQHGKCAICGIDQVWNNQSLKFILDHIDGDASNNDRCNLRLICPNCDSQLPTYKSRNKNSARSHRRQ